ncbi:MAG: TonB-dependent receptor [Cellvibrio sp.]|uniref:TonB-dependent receptor n=1 Tax=Cellvibrio sp. TaxID=1965322 RepID=UPI0031A492A7
MTMHKQHSRTRQLKPLAVACALVSAQLMSLPALAADAPAVEEVIVTASKRGQSLQDFAGAASVITNFAGVKNIGDIANQVPGFSIVDAGPRNPTGLVIRGLRMDEVGSNDLGGDGAAVASYVDNIPLQGYFVPPSFSVKDLQQVEVVRGPQGTLYGNASIGGLIRYVTAKPDLAKQSVRVGAEISQTDHSDDLNYDTDLVVNTPLIDNTLGLRLMLGKTENAGFIDNDYLLTGPAEDINDDETKQARVSLLWQATDNFSLNTMYHYQKINVGDRQATNEIFTEDKYAASSRYLQPMQGELQLASIDAEYDMEFATLTASLNHYDLSHNERADQTDYLIYLGGSYYTDYEDFSAFTAANVDVVKDSVELRLASATDQALRWLVGGFYSRDDLDVLTRDVVPGFAEYSGEYRPGDLDYLATQTETLDEYSVYAEVSYDLTEKLEATLGVRHFRYDDDLEVCWALYPTEDGLNCESGDDVSKDTLGKFSTAYNFTESHNVYFAVAEGYRRGGANLMPVGVTTHRFYAPDTAVNYELGWHGNWLDNRVQLNTALYTIEWSDIQLSLSDDGRGYTGNAGEAQTKGVELNGSIQLNSNIKLLATYNYNNAETTQAVEELAINDGDRLPGSPRTQAGVALDFIYPVHSAEVDANLSFHRTGDVYTALNSEFYNYQKLQSYNIVNARVGVSLRNVRIGAFINNIGNTRGITGARNDGMHGDQGQFEYVTRPRTIGLSATYQY